MIWTSFDNILIWFRLLRSHNNSRIQRDTPLCRLYLHIFVSLSFSIWFSDCREPTERAKYKETLLCVVFIYTYLSLYHSLSVSDCWDPTEIAEYKETCLCVVLILTYLSLYHSLSISDCRDPTKTAETKRHASLSSLSTHICLFIILYLLQIDEINRNSIRQRDTVLCRHYSHIFVSLSILICFRLPRSNRNSRRQRDTPLCRRTTSAAAGPTPGSMDTVSPSGKKKGALS